MKNITPFIWFEKDAKKAADFYVAVFGERSRVKSVSTINDTPSEAVEMVTLELAGHEFNIMSAGPLCEINEAISFVVNCETQQEVDHFWKLLTDGGEPRQCGWLKDRYGVSWQIVPTVLAELMSDTDRVKSGRVTRAMLEMQKLDIATLEKAHRGE